MFLCPQNSKFLVAVPVWTVMPLESMSHSSVFLYLVPLVLQEYKSFSVVSVILASRTCLTQRNCNSD